MSEDTDSPSAPPAASFEPPAAPLADVGPGPVVEAGTGHDAQPSSNPLADAVNAFLEQRLAQGAPTAEEAFAKYRARRQANADAFSAFLNGTGPFPLEGHR